ncbi:10906_t:CDS:2, partial [Racocetra fulgida]
WDLLNCISPILNDDITKEDCEDIKMELEFHLHLISTHNSMSQKVRNKASKRNNTATSSRIDNCDEVYNNMATSSSDYGLIAKNLLGELQIISSEVQSLLNFQEYIKHFQNLLIINEIMDLRPSSEFVLMCTEEEHYVKFIADMFGSIDNLFPEQAF